MYKTIEEIEKDFKVVAYGKARTPFRFWEIHLIKNEDVEKTRPAKDMTFGYNTERFSKKVLPVRTKGVPTNEVLFNAANNYELTAKKPHQ